MEDSASARIAYAYNVRWLQQAAAAAAREGWVSSRSFMMTFMSQHVGVCQTWRMYSPGNLDSISSNHSLPMLHHRTEPMPCHRIGAPTFGQEDNDDESGPTDERALDIWAFGTLLRQMLLVQPAPGPNFEHDVAQSKVMFCTSKVQGDSLYIQIYNICIP